MTCPQQSNFDDCGIFAMMFASQMAVADAAALHLIKAEHIMQYRFYIAICIIEEKMPGVLRVPLCNDGMSSAHVPLTASHLVELLETVQSHMCHSCRLCLYIADLLFWLCQFMISNVDVGDDQLQADDIASWQPDRMQMDIVFDADTPALDGLHLHMQLMQDLQDQEPPDFAEGMPKLSWC